MGKSPVCVFRCEREEEAKVLYELYKRVYGEKKTTFETEDDVYIVTVF